MRNKLLNNNLTNSITKSGVLYKAGEIPALTKEQTEQAKLVSKLPKDFPFANRESMNTKQQLQQMRYSGLNDQDQWSLLNSNVPLSVLDQHNQMQDEIETRASATRIATTLMNAAAQTTVPRTQTTDNKPTNSPSLQTTAQQRKLDMKQEEYQTRVLEKQTQRPGLVNTPKVTTNAQTTESPIMFDSRDAMEQKKDKLWEKIVVPTWREKREDEIWGQVNGKPLTYPAKPVTTPLPQPGLSPNPTTTPNPNTPKSKNDVSEANYNWYSSYDEAVNAWAKSFWRLSKDFEHCALIYKKVDENGNEVYTFGETRIGSQGLPPVFQPNVAKSFANLYFNEKIPDASRVGFVHSHPEPPDGYTVGSFSNWDLALKILPGIDYVTLVPYENEDAEPITK